MAQVQLSAVQSSQPPKDQSTKETWFPRRPAFGTQGTKVTLWANYFKLDMSAKVPLLKYSLKVKRKDSGPKSKGPKEAKGRKLHSILKAALEQVAKSVPYATEFKDQVISLQPFSLPEGQVVTVPYRDEGKDDEYEVKFNGPTTVDIPGLLTYLRTMRDPAVDFSFPRFEDAIDAISVITGYYARSNLDASALGRSRHFPLNLQGEQFDLGQPEFNRIIRGYFQSARPATGRLILNANVAHGVFRPKGFVSDLTNLFRHDYYALNKTLSRLRGECKVLSDDKTKKPRFIQKAIYGLADLRDGTGANRPKVQQLGAKARDVQFYLQAPAPTGLKGDAYCSVADYYKKSKQPFHAFGHKTDIYRIWIYRKSRLPRGQRWQQGQASIYACRIRPSL
jgi:hypothetical protein